MLRDEFASLKIQLSFLFVVLHVARYVLHVSPKFSVFFVPLIGRADCWLDISQPILQGTIV